jgi:hypothetical protein
MAKPDITAAQLREVLDYDPETGVFTRRKAHNHLPAGRVVGTIDSHGYLVVRLDGVLWKAHRLAWLYAHGTAPAGEIDHINGVRFDNRLKNLRDVSASVNSQNRGRAYVRSKSGVIGVSKNRRQWRAQICVRGEIIELGNYKTLEQASEVYLDAKRRLHEGCTL